MAFVKVAGGTGQLVNFPTDSVKDGAVTSGNTDSEIGVRTASKSVLCL
jgi:hypothetical protein